MSQLEMECRSTALFLVLALAGRVGAEIQRTVRVSESAAVGTTVGYISGQPTGAAAAQDSYPFFMVVFLPQSPIEQLFSVDEFSGEIRTRAQLDYEAARSHVFLAMPTDGSDSFRVTIELTDENDNAPAFPHAVHHLSLSEFARLNAQLPVPAAEDADAGQFGLQHYRLVSGNINNAFRLSTRRLNDRLYVDLVVNAPLDREFRETYLLTVEALDGGDPPLTGEMLLNITIADANDNVPQFSRERYEVDALLDDGPPQRELLRVSASDADAGENGRISYFLLPSPSDAQRYFDLDATTGSLRLAGSVTALRQRSFELIVAARDAGAQPLESTAFVTVRRADTQTATRRIDVRYLSDDGAATVSESAPVGHFVARVSLVDAADGSLVSGANVTLARGRDRFMLRRSGSGTFVLVVARALDRETADIHLISLVSSDGDGAPTGKNLSVRVTDVNDNAPEFTRRTFEADVREQSSLGSSILQLTATDADIGDNARLSYRFADNSAFQDWFDIDATTGLLTSKYSIDCEISSRPELQVVVSDNGEPPLSSTATVFVNVLDVNDNAPLFSESVYRARLAEDAPVGFCFLQVKTVDRDCGVNSLVRYDLAESVSQFSVDETSGTLCVAAPLDFETAAAFQLTVTARDGGGLSSSAVVVVQLEDHDDNQPLFYPSVYNVSVHEDVAVGTPLLVVSATDSDSGDFGRVRYSIVDGNADQLFRLDADGGQLYVNGRLQAREYHLRVEAEDGGNLSSVRPASVTVTALRKGYPSPVFEQRLYRMTVREDTLPGIAVGRVFAWAPSPPVYAIYSGDPRGWFSIDRQTGALLVERRLDADLTHSLLLNVQAAVGQPKSYNHTQVQVIIEDVNDNAPVFDSSLLYATVSEDQPLQEPFFSVHATDHDSGRNGQLTYRLLNSVSAGPFIVRPHSGELLLVDSLDFEKQTTYRLAVAAVDGGVPAKSANVTIELTVRDVNDNTPVFSSRAYEAFIGEDAPLQSEVLRLRASDGDSGHNGEIVFTLSNASESAFGVMADSGVVYVRRQLDRESEPSHQLTAVAADRGRPSRQARVTVRVHLLDVNDNAPACSRGAALSVSEQAPVGSLVGRIGADDPDAGLNGTVHLSLIATEAPFRLTDAGELYTTEALDAETRPSYRLEYSAVDGGASPQHTECHVDVIVEDENDNAPFFVLPTQNRLVVREEQPVGTEVVQIRANDLDQGDNGRVSYHLSSGPASQFFSLDKETGVLTTANVLDFESMERPQFEIQVVAQDSGKAPRRAAKTFVVELQDVADGVGRMLQDRSENATVHMNVSESVAIGSRLGVVDTQVKQTAETQIEFMFTLVGGNELGLFELNSVTSELYLARALDFELSSAHRLEVSKSAASSGLRLASFAVRVAVVDENDNAPVFADDPIVFSVAEDSRRGEVVWRCEATDADVGANGRVVYRIAEQSPEAAFAVDRVTGELSLQVELDRERQREYLLVVEASDQAADESARRSARVTARAFVTDVNDNRPRFVSASRLTVTGDVGVGAPLFRVAAVDSDALQNARLTYSILSGNELGYFRINSSSGELSLARWFEYDVATEYELLIEARDHGSPSLSARQSLSISTEKFTAGAVKFEQSRYQANVTENQPGGTTILQLNARSTDSKPANIIYMLANELDEKWFHVDKTTGLLQSAQTLDREIVDEYHLTVYALSGTASFDVATVIVLVSDENDNTPQISAHSCQPLFVPENRAFDNLRTLAAWDADAPHNARLQFAITGGNEDGRFVVDAASGRLSCAPLDRETVDWYKLTVEARDAGRPSQSARCQLTVRVGDDNDNRPRFDARPNAVVVIAEDAPLGVAVGRASALDADSGINGRLTYALINDSCGCFDINPETAELVLLRPLDFEVASEHVLGVRATDQSPTSPLHADTQLTVRVTDVNDNAPVFSQANYAVQLPRTLAVGQRIAKLTATDADGDGANSAVAYRLLHPSDDLSVNPKTGVLSAKRAVDLTPGVVRYEVVVASDGAANARSSLTFVKMSVEQSEPSAANLAFDEDTYEATLPWRASVGDHVISCTVRQQSLNDIQYNILTTDVDRTFGIETWSGKVYVVNAKKVRDSAGRSVRLLIEARVGASVAFASLDVVIDDPAESAPQFLQARYFTTMAEGAERGAVVLRVSAWQQGGPEDAPLTYSIVSGNLDSAFAIDADGSVRTNVRLDREIVDEYNLRLTASDAASPPRAAHALLQVKVNDVNDNRPSFPSTHSFSVSESAPVGTLLGALTANDVDSAPPLQYRIVGELEQLTVDRFSGQLLLARSLDYELQQEFSFQLAVGDGVNEATCDVRVLIDDDNDNWPRFDRPFQQVAVAEGTPVGTQVARAVATDADSGHNGRISYSMLPADSAFHIDQSSGIIYANRTVTSRSGEIIRLTVVATDGGSEQKSTACAFLLRVFKQTKADQPEFAESRFSFEIMEDAPLQSIVGQLKLKDATTAAGVLFEIVSGDPSHHFSLNGVGELIVERRLDREAHAAFALVVGARSAASGGGVIVNSTARVDVRVADVNDNAPVFVETIAELVVDARAVLGAPIGRVSASDADAADNGRVAYRITSGNEDALVQLDADSGVLSLRALPSPLLGANRRLVVAASDAGTPTQTDFTVVALRFVNVSGNEPFFPIRFYAGAVVENTPPGALLFTAKAVSRVGGAADDFTYSLELSQQDVGLFRIDSAAGQVRTTAPLDFETSESHRFRVYATGADGRRSAAEAFVRVLGADEYDAVFNQSSFQFKVPFDAPKGTIVGAVAATDADAGSDGQVVFSIVEDTPYFAISTEAGGVGRIFVRSSLSSLADSPSNASRRVRRSAAVSAPEHSSNDTSIRTLILTISASSLTHPSRFASAKVTLVLGNFVGLYPTTSTQNGGQLITIVSIILLLILVLLLLFLALKLRRKRDKPADKSMDKLKTTHLSGSSHSNSILRSPPVAIATAAWQNGHACKDEQRSCWLRENGVGERQTAFSCDDGTFAAQFIHDRSRVDAAPPPLPPVGGSASRRQLNSISTLSNKSSGRGSVFGDEAHDTSNDDDEIGRLTARAVRQTLVRSVPDSGIDAPQLDDDDDDDATLDGVPSAREYLTSLGVTEARSGPPLQRQDSRAATDGAIGLADADAADVNELIYCKVSQVLAEDGGGGGRHFADAHRRLHFPPVGSPLPVIATRALHHPGLPSAASWGPAYQPLTQVFSEISRLRSEQDTPKAAVSQAGVWVPQIPTPTELPHNEQTGDWRRTAAKSVASSEPDLEIRI